MEFDFLPKLPKSDLDDRKFQDLVNECILRIPRYTPEWTNYNASDPGITLIELFAWLTDQMLFRFNQVPRRNYVTFLELLGIRLQPATSATTDATFYLSTSLTETYTIPKSIEVATVRTETEEAIVFSTDLPLTIDNPRIRNILTGTADPTAPKEKPPKIRRDFIEDNYWEQLPLRQGWKGRDSNILTNEPPKYGSCFYIVFHPEQQIQGNVIAITVTGAAATSTGIDPKNPPLYWEAWNGEEWESVLLNKFDDHTQGFSFSELTRQGAEPNECVADVILHLPKKWQVIQFSTYEGYWLRCRYSPPENENNRYIRSPRLRELRARSIGGTVGVTQCTKIRHEILGESDGTSGQTFQLTTAPILQREEEEYILVTPPGESPQRWQEVKNFADSGPRDKHYTIDSIEGVVQFGPKILGPSRLRSQTQLRARSQGEKRANLTLNGLNGTHHQEEYSTEQQYGAVPPRGAEISMYAYRTGGGAKGNVDPKTIKVLKSAIPYITKVINHKSARGGMDAQSLEKAAIAVPRQLRTRDRAVTVEDFENLALKAGEGAIAKARCYGAVKKEEAGKVCLLLVPQPPDLEAIKRRKGINPDDLELREKLQEQVKDYLDERRLIGVEVKYGEPDYVGVQVKTEVALEPEYQNPLAQKELHQKIEVELYRFLNPITGGPEKNGWPFGRNLYVSDIYQVLQAIPGVLYLGTVQLFKLSRNGLYWKRSSIPERVIKLEKTELLSSWHDDKQLSNNHVINFI